MHASLRSSAVALAVGFGLSAQAATIHVPADQPSIAAGLAAAQPGDEVVLSCGTYFEHDLSLRAGVTVRSDSGDPNCVTVDAGGLGSAFRALLLETQAVVEGITIRNGSSVSGGGINAYVANLLVRRCRLFDNVAVQQGSAICGSNSTIRLEDLQVARNRVTGTTMGSSGALSFIRADAEIENCTITYNTNAGAPGVTAGGVRGADRSFIRIDHTIVALNSSPQIAGHIDVTWTFDCYYDSNPLFCDASTNDFRLNSSSPCLPGVTCTELIGALTHGCGPVSTRNYTVATNPTGLPVVVDGVTYTAPVTLTWTQYTEHTIEAPKTVSVGAGSQRAFRSWSDGRDRVHRVWATRDPYTWTATFDLQHYLTMTTPPRGSVTPPSAWFAAGSQTTVTATPARGDYLERWEGSGAGSYSGPENPAVVTMSGPLTETAVFAPIAYEFSVSASDVDPHMNVASPVGGFRFLYFWLTCSRGGLAAFEADVSSTLPILGFEPLNGVLNAGTPSHLLLAIPGCPSGDATNLLLGRWNVWDALPGGSLCLGGGNDTGGRITLGAVDCETLQPFCARFPGLTGFSSSAAPPCQRGGQGCSGAQILSTPLAASSIDGVEPHTALLPSVPNPFSASTTVRFTLAAPARATLRIYDVGGRLVRSLVAEELPAGTHERLWDGRDANSRGVTNGIYFLRLESRGQTSTQKILHVSR